VLIDATFRQEKQRRAFLDAAVRWGVPAALLVCRAAPATVRQRLEARRGDASDADWSVYTQAAGLWEEAAEPTRAALHEIAMDGSAEQSVSRALAILRERGLAG
jgi:predicted kinase